MRNLCILFLLQNFLRSEFSFSFSKKVFARLSGFLLLSSGGTFNCIICFLIVVAQSVRRIGEIRARQRLLGEEFLM